MNVDNKSSDQLEQKCRYLLEDIMKKFALASLALLISVSLFAAESASVPTASASSSSVARTSATTTVKKHQAAKKPSVRKVKAHTNSTNK